MPLEDEREQSPNLTQLVRTQQLQDHEYKCNVTTVTFNTDNEDLRDEYSC